MANLQVNVQYTGGDNRYFISQFCEDELNLNSLPNMVLEFILTRGLLCHSLSDHYQTTYKYVISCTICLCINIKGVC